MTYNIPLLKNAFAKTVIVSLSAMAAAFILSIVYGFFAAGNFTLAYVFNANFLAGSGLICLAFIKMALPTGIKHEKPAEHPDMTEFFEQHRQKRKKAYRYLFSGILVIIIAGLIQMALSWKL